MADGMARQNGVSALDDHLGYWLRFVSNQVSQAFAAKVTAEGATVAEWVVLRELYDGPGLLQGALAERIGMTPGAISKLADRLLAKQLIERRSDDGDRRTQRLNLTRAGRRLVPKLAALADRNDAEFFGHLKRDQRHALETLLREIVERQGLRNIPID